MSMQFNSLSYIVQHTEYNLALYTTLAPLDSETYNSSFTVMNYAPVGKSELVSLEFVEFNSSVTLSQQYAVLGKVAKEAGKVYEKSGDKTLAQLAQGYYTMQEEAKYLSKLVEKQLQEYNKEILRNSAILMDVGSIWNCVNCLVWIAINAALDPTCTVCAACVTGIIWVWWLVVACIATCAYCIVSWAAVVWDCCLCAEYMGWIDCPFA